jgi:hypothetical protein
MGVAICYLTTVVPRAAGEQFRRLLISEMRRPDGMSTGDDRRLPTEYARLGKPEKIGERL